MGQSLPVMNVPLAQIAKYISVNEKGLTKTYISFSIFNFKWGGYPYS